MEAAVRHCFVESPDSSRACKAFVHDAGLPIRIAVAMVVGLATGCPRTNGAAPAAWKPNIRGVPGTRVLATSRTPLGLEVEVVVAVDPLGPDGDSDPAVELFDNGPHVVWEHPRPVTGTVTKGSQP